VAEAITAETAVVTTRLPIMTIPTPTMKRPLSSSDQCLVRTGGRAVGLHVTRFVPGKRRSGEDATRLDWYVRVLSSDSGDGPGAPPVSVKASPCGTGG
jgi:hypothetical protein